MRRNVDQTGDEQEYRLWEASRDYIQGKIDIHELEKIERSHTQDFRKALITSAKRSGGKGRIKKKSSWTDEHEQDLWMASRLYINGTIDVYQLERTELSYTKSFIEALFSLAKKNLRWHFINLFFLQRKQQPPT